MLDLENLTKDQLEEVEKNKKKLVKFTTDPDWEVVERLLHIFMNPLLNVSEVETKGKSNDEIASEIRGRQIAYDCLKEFLGNMSLIREQEERPSTGRTFT